MTDKATKEEGATAVKDLVERLLEHWAEESLRPNSPINLIEFLHESDETEALTLDDLETLRVKEEIERLLKAGFIRTARYVEWLANIVPVLKRTEALRVCTDYRNLNLATPKDEYPMPMSDLLVDGAAKHELLSFMDGHAGYNQIFVAEEDVHKMAFRCQGAIGTYEWVVMPFGLKNAGATYQRAMNLIFHDLIGRTVEVYIDDVVVKSPSKADHVGHLRQAFNRMQAHGLKMNPKKCAFSVTAGNFLGFLIISKTDLIKYMLTQPIIRGRIGKWTMALSEFTFQYVAQKSVKGQALADFLAHHPAQGKEGELEVEIGMARMEKNYWTMYFDGSSTEARLGAGVVIESPQGQRWQVAFQLDFKCTNNQAEYEALIIGLEILKEIKATRVLVYGDSQLVINQLTGEYQCTSENLTMYYVTALNTADVFSRISFVHVPRAENHEANEMAQVASVVNIPGIKRRTLPALAERGMATQVSSAEISDEVNTAEADWRYPIVKYLRDPSGSHERTTRFRARCYLIYQNELYRKGSDGLLLLCPNAEDIKNMQKDVSNVKSTAPYKEYRPKPSTRLPNHGRSEDGPWISLAKSIRPNPTNMHGFWWRPTISLNGSRPSPNGPVFASTETREYTERLGIKLVYSTPYYPQSNGQAEASNKVIKGILDKMVEEKPRAWHDLLPEALWAYRISKRSATGTSPYALTYGHDAIVPMELKVRSLHVAEQPGQEGKDYAQAMAQELEDLEQSRLDAYNLMQAQKQISARAYNKKVKQKTFAEGDLVWRAVLPIRTKDPRFGKFSPNWEGPFIIERILGRGAFQLKDRDGEWHNLPING
ncbi:uncharacterized protein LOC110751539 [Prunus avium]|uniref:Uncharacterized protein LOC110751539 n=1 Tax=Prunus avium TaxID=42229 RepID=A0A6P5S2Q3_PRUAV|nr:uncharacterized protein LOC110751539 [Prunus avium]